MLDTIAVNISWFFAYHSQELHYWLAFYFEDRTANKKEDEHKPWFEIIFHYRV